MRAVERREVAIPVVEGRLGATLTLPSPGRSTILFAHGSGSSRHSPRNRFVAQVLNEAGFGTLLLDLLTEREDARVECRFDISLLANRLMIAAEWLKGELGEPGTAMGLFGASTGAAAALVAAAKLGPEVRAVVSRGGRPDLAEEALAVVKCPTLLIVGEADVEVADLNRWALARLPETTVAELAIVPGATHLFEEPGALEKVAELARDWFIRYAGGSDPSR